MYQYHHMLDVDVDEAETAIRRLDFLVCVLRYVRIEHYFHNVFGCSSFLEDCSALPFQFLPCLATSSP